MRYAGGIRPLAMSFARKGSPNIQGIILLNMSAQGSYWASKYLDNFFLIIGKLVFKNILLVLWRKKIISDRRLKVSGYSNKTQYKLSTIRFLFGFQKQWTMNEGLWMNELKTKQMKSYKSLNSIFCFQIKKSLVISPKFSYILM